MRPTLVVVLTLVSFTSIASAQTSDAILRSQLAVAPASAEEVVARVMLFDRNNDGRVETIELIERMRTLVARGDANRDGALDRTEILWLAAAPPPAQATVRGFQGGRYGFADQNSLSSRSHIEDALDDLRLAGATHERALAVAGTFVDTLEAAATTSLLNELQDVLTKEQLGELKTALDIQIRRFRSEKPAGLAGNVTDRPTVRDIPSLLLLVPGPAAPQTNRGTCPGAGIFCNPTAPTFQPGLPFAENRQVADAIERFRTRLRPGDAERSALVEQMRDILSDEERDNFRAALERRPVKRSLPL